ncbi:heterokaryon incompatibility protein-domain-containing protein [Apiospora arundinis]|uniref:Heterokaryon incompatibility protein-domain-containing protein n=1 Tax=Apiospora arundinis TaxID=335852 RepID=A0ABR2HLV8_9PEZI
MLLNTPGHPDRGPHSTDWNNDDMELDEQLNTSPQNISAPSGARPSPYESLPLVPKGRQIRVFDLDGAYDQWDMSRIKGNLRLVDLDDSPSFTALSYVWGEYSSPARDTIDCNGCSIEVTRNCLSALRHLRKIFGAITIWIDAICINQAETSEKAYQITLMGQVYSSAQTVYAWLGEGNEKSDGVMGWLARGPRLIRLFAFDHAAFHEARVPTGSLASVRLAFYLYLSLTTSSYEEIRYRAGLRDILSRPWIRRLWTLQEAVLPRQLQVICGTKVIPWLSFIRGIDHVEMLQFNLPGIEGWCSLKDTWRRHHQDAQLASRDAGELEDNRSPIGDSATYKVVLKAIRPWLITILTLHVTFPVFATFCLTILGIYVKRRSFIGFICLLVILPILVLLFFALTYPSRGSSLRRWLRLVFVRPVSWDRSLVLEIAERQSSVAEDKFFGVYEFIHQNQQGQKKMPDYSHTTLDILYRLLFKQVVRYTGSLDILLFTPSRMLRAPTWVVDWRSVSTCWFMLLRGFSGATPGSKAQCKFAGAKTLLVRAQIVSRIVYSTITAPSDTPHSSGDAAAVFMHAMAGFDYKDVARSLLSHQQYIRWRTVQFMGPRIRLWQFLTSKTHKQYESKWGVPVGIMKYYFWGSRFNDIFEILAWNRMSLVRCSSEMLSDFGYASDKTNDGDLVALISGVTLPMILREKNQRPGHYEVVGPAFFGSVMEGEVWQRIDKDNLDELVLI